jgi:endonuclease YncB( thermonuclease family)
MRWLDAFALLLVIWPGLAHADGGDWAWNAVGQAIVIDGDTLEMLGPTLAFCPPPEPCPDEEFPKVRLIKVRLFGIDAPETDQTCLTAAGVPWACGVAAAIALRDLIAGDDVTCFGGGPEMGARPDRYGRQFATCHVWPRSNLNADMVRFGWALAHPRLLRTYSGSEAIARDARVGIWSGEFIPPWEWRAKKEVERRRMLNDIRRRLRRHLSGPT